MGLIGTFAFTATAAIAATTSTTLTHGLGTTPHMVWGQLGGTSTASISRGGAPVSVAFGSASISCYNRGETAETYTVCGWVMHSLIQ